MDKTKNSLSIEEWERTYNQELNTMFNFIKKETQLYDENLLNLMTYDKFIDFCYKQSSTNPSKYTERQTHQN